MTMSDGTADFPPQNRWYDQDPVLGRAVEQLRQASDKPQAQIALNIIKIIVEHQIEEKTETPPEHLDSTLPHRPSWDDTRQHRRWYDVHETLSSAMQMLHDCPDDLQRRIIPSLAQMIEHTLSQIPGDSVR